jgi:four helix bundle protein
LARQLAFGCRQAAKLFPPDEADLAAQLRRAADSIVLNIAEGTAKGTNRELRQFLETARGSMKEVEAALVLANDSELIPEPLRSRLPPLAEETARTLFGYWRTVNERIANGEKDRLLRPITSS